MPVRPPSVRGSMASSAGAASVQLVGMEDVMAALDKLAGLNQNASAVIGTDLTDPPYPYFLEYGTSRMGAHPSARPAFDEMHETASRTVADVLGQLAMSGSAGPGAVSLALVEGARPIENRWKELAPYATGTYRRSIHTEVES